MGDAEPGEPVRMSFVYSSLTAPCPYPRFSYEHAPVMAGEEPVEEGGAGAPDVEVPGRAWCKSCFNHWVSVLSEVLVIIKNIHPFINLYFPAPEVGVSLRKNRRKACDPPAPDVSFNLCGKSVDGNRNKCDDDWLLNLFVQAGIIRSNTGRVSDWRSNVKNRRSGGVSWSWGRENRVYRRQSDLWNETVVLHHAHS